jgi:protein involved in polysaccharide export with SLBB domain
MARSPRTHLGTRKPVRITSILTVACLTVCLSGCGLPKDIYDYINPGNSFLDPSQVGRFDRDNPFGDVKPVKWPILDQLDVVDEPADRWSNATDPTPADLVANNQEYAVGPGDILHITVWELVQPGTDYVRDQATVSESGGVSLQNLGIVQVAGLTPSQVEEKIGQLAVEKNLLLPKGNGSQGPQVTVSVLQSRSRVFSILGMVNQTGTYNVIGSDFRVLDALALARDIQGTEPGMDYLYVIPRHKEAPLAPPSAAVSPSENTSGTPTPGTGNPLDALDSLDKTTTAPATPTPTPSPSPAPLTPSAPAPTPDMTPTPTPPSTPPATGPGAAGPRFLRPIPMAAVVSSDSAPMLAQADMDAALSLNPTSTTAPVLPATAAAPEATTSPAATSAPADDLLNQAMGSSTTKAGSYVFIDGKWVAMPSNPTTVAVQPGTTAGATSGGPGPVETAANPPTPYATSGPAATESFAGADEFMNQRVIRIPINPLREGNPKYNIIIKPGDTIIVPSIEQGLFYMMGHVNKPGVYSIAGQKITLKMAVAAAGNLDALAIPRRCDLVRRIGTNQEVTVQVNLQAIFDGTQPDIFLKSNDLINVGTDLVAPILAVTRNGYRAAYGFGFTYDRNYYITPTIIGN